MIGLSSIPGNASVDGGRNADIFTVVGGGGDNLQNFDLAKNHLTIGSDHKINDFCFLTFFISMNFEPHQAQKTIFHRFEQCGISLDMFERVK